jgi:uncharacterized protein YodC (DUF2158 family)
MATKSDLNIGDSVRLKGGELSMTVVSDPSASPGIPESVTCAWHAGSKPEQHRCPVAAQNRDRSASVKRAR